MVCLLLLGLWAAIFRNAAAYLLQSAKGQSELMFNGSAIEEVLAAPDTPEERKRQLRLVIEVKNFAETELKLKATRNYEKFVDLGRDYLVMVLTASPPLKLESYTWWFPIVGTVPYKGFFDLEMGKAAQAKLKDQGYETYFRSAPAYSTLGWFHDPLINTMLGYGDFYLVSTVIHESVHATHWVPGEVTFNENMATFIGQQGALQFYAKKYGQGSDKYKNAQQKLLDQKVFAKFMNSVYEKLDKVYKSDAFEPNKYEQRVALIKTMKEFYANEVLKIIKSPGYAGFEKKEWNNAMMLSYRHYNQDQDKLEHAFNKLDRDIPRMMDFLKRDSALSAFR